MSRHPTLSPIEHRPHPYCSHFEVEDISATTMSVSLNTMQNEFDPPSKTAADPASASPLTIMPTPYPQLILFGDSITEFSTLTLQAYLQTQYVRRLDVLNRGFSGFTSAMGLQVLTKVLPPLSQQCPDPDPCSPTVKIVTMFFGANDAVLPPAPQHVPIPLYLRCTAKMIRYIQTRRPEDNTKIIIIPPPPVDEHQINPDNSRRACTTGQYAQAAQQLAAKCNLPCVDVWSIFMKKAGWNESMGRDCCRYGEGLENIPQTRRARENPLEYNIETACKSSQNHNDTSQASAHTRFPSLQSRTPSPTNAPRDADSGTPVHIPGCIHAPPNSVLDSLLLDGVHLTTAGYKILFWALLKCIKDDIPEYAPENCPYVITEWRKALGVEQQG